MKLSRIVGNIYGFNLRRAAHSSDHYFQDGYHFSKWPPFFEVRTLKSIEIIDFHDHSGDSYLFDNTKTEYWVFNLENPTWRSTVAISKMTAIIFEKTNN